MWTKSEKHLTLSILFLLLAQTATGWLALPGIVMSVAHVIAAMYYSFKED